MPEAKKGKAVFPDQGAKLRYLLDTRGDQRKRVGQSSYILGETVARGEDNVPARIVVSQADLAAELSVHSTTVGRWIAETQRVPLQKLSQICGIFDADPADFKKLGIGAFIEACDTRSEGAHEKITWRGVLRHAATGMGRILLQDPISGGAGKMRYAGIPSVDDQGEPIPEIPAKTPFWMEFRSPRGPSGHPAWAGWNVLLFNHDIRQQGFRCLLPAYQNHAAFAAAKFPKNGGLDLPRGPILTHPAGDLGDFEMVLVVSQDVVDEKIAEPLAARSAEGGMIEDALRQLAQWLDPRLGRGEAAIAKALYQVVAPPNQDGGSRPGLE